jgi:hypothetical protein
MGVASIAISGRAVASRVASLPIGLRNRNREIEQRETLSKDQSHYRC